MKCAAVFLLVSFALLSQAFAVLRPLFPLKPAPPLGDELIVAEEDLVRGSAKEPRQVRGREPVNAGTQNQNLVPTIRD
jgi:hypothetical protein